MVSEKRALRCVAGALVRFVGCLDGGMTMVLAWVRISVLPHCGVNIHVKRSHVQNTCERNIETAPCDIELVELAGKSQIVVDIFSNVLCGLVSFRRSTFETPRHYRLQDNIPVTFY